MSDTADWIEKKYYTCVRSSVCSGCNLPCCLCFCSGSGEDSLDRLLPPAGAPRRKSATSLSKTEPPLLRTGTRTIYTAGRPPWYDEHGAQSKEAFVIGMMMFLLLLTVFSFHPLRAKRKLWAAEPVPVLLLCLYIPINTLCCHRTCIPPDNIRHTLKNTHNGPLKCCVDLQGCVGAAPQGRPPWPIRSLRLWMCRGLCCCLWILSTRWERHAFYVAVTNYLWVHCRRK